MERNHWQKDWSERRWKAHVKKTLAREKRSIELAGQGIEWETKREILKDAENEAYYEMKKEEHNKYTPKMTDEELDDLVKQLTGF